MPVSTPGGGNSACIGIDLLFKKLNTGVGRLSNDFGELCVGDIAVDDMVVVVAAALVRPERLKQRDRGGFCGQSTVTKPVTVTETLLLSS